VKLTSEDKKGNEKVAKKKTLARIDKVILRNYSKVIFFYPLFITSFILWIIEYIAEGELFWLGFFWLIMLFLNLFVMAFDVSSTKFFIILLVIIVFILLLIFMIIPNVSIPGFQSFIDTEASIKMTKNFYLGITIILGIVLLLAIIGANFDYWKLERNEVYHKKGLFSSANRYPIKGLRINKEILDVFELFALRAGSITLIFSNDKIFHLSTVLNVNKKSEQIDYLLSHMEVEIN